MYRDAAAGGGGVVDRDHAWHDFARQWQTPGPGDRVMDEVMAPDIAAGILVQSSVPPDIAVDVAAAVGDRMKKVMLRLHQSATDPGGEWHEGVDGITRPGLVLWGRDDPFAATGRGRKSTGAILGDADVMRIAQDYRLRLGGCFSLSRVCSWPVRRVYGRPFFLGPGQRPKSCSRLQTLYGERRPEAGRRCGFRQGFASPIRAGARP